MSDLLMHKIKKRAMARATRTDLGEPSSTEIAPPLEADARSRAERALGFPCPALLAALYAKIGNGGYGPGYGLLGVAGGATDDQGYDAVELYALYRQPDPDDPSWAWPEGLLPLCHWGCVIYGCVDCTREPHPVIVFDPNPHDGDWSRCFLPRRDSLEGWLAAWADGVDLWEELYGDGNPT